MNPPSPSSRPALRQTLTSIFQTAGNEDLPLSSSDWALLELLLRLNETPPPAQASIRIPPPEKPDLAQEIALIRETAQGPLSEKTLQQAGVPVHRLSSLRSLHACYRFFQGLSPSTNIAQIIRQGNRVQLIFSGPRGFPDGVRAQSQSAPLAQILETSLYISCQNPPSVPQIESPPLDIRSPGISPHDPLQDAAQKILRFHFAHLIHHEPGARTGEDPEDLHKMRVASRRMRCALRVLGPFFQDHELTPFAYVLKEITGMLGRVRDLDVFIIRISENIKSEALPSSNHLARLLPLAEQDRDLARQEMIKFLDARPYQDFLKTFHHVLNTPYPDPSSRPLEDCLQDLLQERRSVIAQHRAGLTPASLPEQHKLRILVKRLRYTIEFFTDLLGPSQDEVLTVLKTIQDHLGALNDTKQARAILTKWEERRPKEAPGTVQAINHYTKVQESRQRGLFSSLPETWTRYDDPAFEAEFTNMLPNP
jgi:CHAD domain-containing protein